MQNFWQNLQSSPATVAQKGEYWQNIYCCTGQNDSSLELAQLQKSGDVVSFCQENGSALYYAIKPTLCMTIVNYVSNS